MGKSRVGNYEEGADGDFGAPECQLSQVLRLKPDRQETARRILIRERSSMMNEYVGFRETGLTQRRSAMCRRSLTRTSAGTAVFASESASARRHSDK